MIHIVISINIRKVTMQMGVYICCLAQDGNIIMMVLATSMIS
jgi:hypothetical protein